jgi:hypothetical protein
VFLKKLFEVGDLLIGNIFTLKTRHIDLIVFMVFEVLGVMLAFVLVFHTVMVVHGKPIERHSPEKKSDR